ncbi:MAG: hypothetical protein QW421_06345 [Archaeoglobaceae archaeon]
MKVDRKKGVILIENFSEIKGNIDFDGSIFVGIGCKLEDLKGKELFIGKGSSFRNAIAERIVLGAFSTFKRIEANSVILMNGCKGEEIFGKFVKIGERCEINEIRAISLELSGNSKVVKISVEKLRCLSHFK